MYIIFICFLKNFIPKILSFIGIFFCLIQFCFSRIIVFSSPPWLNFSTMYPNKDFYFFFKMFQYLPHRFIKKVNTYFIYLACINDVSEPFSFPFDNVYALKFAKFILCIQIHSHYITHYSMFFIRHCPFMHKHISI